jgi:hypothetical protein
MSMTVRWVVAAVAAVMIVALLIWARGQSHHRGSEVGQSAGSIVSTTGR